MVQIFDPPWHDAKDKLKLRLSFFFVYIFCSDKAELCRHKDHSKTYQDKTHIWTLQETGED